MKHFFLALAVLTCALLQAQPVKILWIGNSYTGANDLPAVVKNLALSAGDSIEHDATTPGGYTLQQHSTNATTIQKIYAQKWDYVVIQAQSQEPSFSPAQVAAQTYPYARVLDSLITDNDSCTETIFYMTWGRKYGDQQNCAVYPMVCTYEGMQQRLRHSYLQMAEDNRALVAPAGMAWYKSRSIDSLINLWSGDNSHPSIEGTYLTACVFYSTIFRKSPVGLSYSPLAQSAATTHLQTIAAQTVFDSLSTWKIGSYDPYSSFDFTSDAATKTVNLYTSGAENYTSLQWVFGDGTTSSVSGAHTYNNPGTYTAQLVVYDDCGRSDTSEKTITISQPTGIGSTLLENDLSVYPNPCHDYLLVNTGNLSQDFITLTDGRGRIVGQQKIHSATTRVETIDMAPGIYFLQAGDVRKRIMKW